jgi:hypothetical protein
MFKSPALSAIWFTLVTLPRFAAGRAWCLYLVAPPPCSSNTVTKVASQTARQYVRYLVRASLAIAATRLKPTLRSACRLTPSLA